MSAIAVVLAGASTASQQATLTPVTVYFNPGSADGAGIEYCKESGVCAKHGLAVKFLYSTQGGPQIIPAMVSGKVQFGEPGYEDTIVAASQGIPIIAIAPVSVAATSDKTDWTVDLSLAGGPVKTLCDLPGKTVAINSLLGLGQLFVDANYYNAHCAGDPTDTGWKQIKFVAILFPQMPTALQKGEVDAIWTLEPFYSVVEVSDEDHPAGGFRVPDRAARADHGAGHVGRLSPRASRCRAEDAARDHGSRTGTWPDIPGDPETDRKVHHDSEEPDPAPDPADVRSARSRSAWCRKRPTSTCASG